MAIGGALGGGENGLFYPWKNEIVCLGGVLGGVFNSGSRGYPHIKQPDF